MKGPDRWSEVFDWQANRPWLLVALALLLGVWAVGDLLKMGRQRTLKRLGSRSDSMNFFLEQQRLIGVPQQPRDELQELESKLALLQANLAAAEGLLPEATEMACVVSVLSASREGLRPRVITQVRDEQVLGMEQLVLRVKLAGGYGPLQRYLDSLDDAAQYLQIEDFDITLREQGDPGETLESSLNVAAYVRSKTPLIEEEAPGVTEAGAEP